MSEFFKPLTKGTEDIISRTPIEPDKLRFTTDTGKLYLDTPSGRVEFTDIINNLTDSQINLLQTYSDKIYLAKDTSRLYVYNKTLGRLIEIANTATNVAHANTASYTEDPDDPAETDRIASQKWTNSAIAEAIGQITEFKILIVNQLPSSGEPYTIYFVPSEDPETGNIYEEYMWLNNKWELLGTTKIDLSNYYNSYEVTGDGSFISGVSASGNKISFTKSAAGTVSYATNAGTATYGTNAGTASYATNAGTAARATNATNASSATYATNAGTATKATNADTASYATNAGTAAKATTATNATNADTATYATNAGTASKSTNADTATYAKNAGTATKATSATNASSADYATNAGTATYAGNSGTAVYSSNAGTAARATNATSASYSDHGVESIEREGDTSVFKVTRSNGTTLSFTQLDPGSASYSYTASNGIQVTDDRKIRNLGVLAVATGDNNGTVKITTANTNGVTSTTNVAVKGLGNLAYVSSTTATTANYATNAGTATRATNADTATYATNAGTAARATNATNADTATYATNAGTATRATNADTATYATSAGDGISHVTTNNDKIVIVKTNGTSESFLPPLYVLDDGLGFQNVSGIRYLKNTGVTKVQTGATNGTVKVTTNGSTADVSVKGLGNLAYLSSTTATTANYGTNAGTAEYAKLATLAKKPYITGDNYWDFGLEKDENLTDTPYTWDPVNYTNSVITTDFVDPRAMDYNTIYFLDLYVYNNMDPEYLNLYGAYIRLSATGYKYYGVYYLNIR